MGPRVMIEKAFGAAASTSRHARVSLKRPSAGWYGSVAAPIAICSYDQEGRESSPASTSATFTFPRIDRP